MADLSITAANVVQGAGARSEASIAGAAVTAGQVVYKSSTTGKWLLADNNSATAEAKVGQGIALNSAAANQPIVVQTGGEITIGATLTAGTAYFLSDTAGGIGPASDLASGESVCLVGIAKSTSVLVLNFMSVGVTL